MRRDLVDALLLSRHEVMGAPGETSDGAAARSVGLERVAALADSLPAMVWLATESGERTFANRRLLEFTGRQVGEELGWGWLAAVHPEDVGLLRSRYERRSPLLGNGELEYRLRRHDGAYRWVIAQEVPAPAGTGPDPPHLVGAALDASAWPEAGQLVAPLGDAVAAGGASSPRSEAAGVPLEGLGAALGVACRELGAASVRLLVPSEDGLSLSPVASAGEAGPADAPQLIPLNELSPASEAARRRRPLYLGEGPGETGASAFIPLVWEGDHFVGVLEVHHRRLPGGDRIRLDGGPAGPATPGRRLLEAIAALAAGAAFAARLERSLGAERAVHEHRARQLMLISRANAELAASLDLDAIMKAVERLAVPTVAEHCAVGLGSAPEPPPGDRERASTVLPLRARGRTLGWIALSNEPAPPGEARAHDGEPGEPAARSSERGEPPDRLLAEGLAACAAVAVDNALRFRHESEIAERLQRALLPRSLPRLAGLSLEARYGPATAGLDVGGDFYDGLKLDDDHLLLVVGDVKGKGLDAAASTGLAVHTIRAAALHNPRPAAILRHLNAVLLLDGGQVGDLPDAAPWQIRGEWVAEPRFCTAVVALVSREHRSAAWSAEICCAGHPLPLVRRPDGSVVAAGRPGGLLGIGADVRLKSERVLLEAGSVMLMYSDGVSESRRANHQFGEEGISAVLAAEEPDVRRITRRLEEEALRFAGDRPPRDDMVVLAAAVGEAPARADEVAGRRRDPS